MGTRFSPQSYGHFGRSGVLVLIDPVKSIVVAAAAGESFGPWAVRRWPAWIDELYEAHVST
jgi:CubicO group peptidase (beta-lactamase class C family)